MPGIDISSKFMIPSSFRKQLLEFANETRTTSKQRITNAEATIEKTDANTELLKKALRFAEEHHLDLNNPVDFQKIIDEFAPTEKLELTPMQPVPIPQETPELKKPEALGEINQRIENGEQRPEQGV